MVAMMGVERNIGRALTGMALAVVGGASQANSGEPLIVAKLADPETHLISMEGEGAARTDDPTVVFAKAIAAASAARQQRMEAQCRSTAAVPEAGQARLVWEANCRYHRH
jgi:hypothetical protein